MAIKVGSARIDENGKASGGKVGDQTGKEVSTDFWCKYWYTSQTAVNQMKTGHPLHLVKWSALLLHQLHNAPSRLYNVPRCLMPCMRSIYSFQKIKRVSGRTVEEITEHITDETYTRSKGKVIKGLVRRRQHCH